MNASNSYLIICFSFTHKVRGEKKIFVLKTNLDWTVFR
jgi:hypothetical protein